MPIFSSRPGEWLHAVTVEIRDVGIPFARVLREHGIVCVVEPSVEATPGHCRYSIFLEAFVGEDAFTLETRTLLHALQDLGRADILPGLRMIEGFGIGVSESARDPDEDEDHRWERKSHRSP